MLSMEKTSNKNWIAFKKILGVFLIILGIIGLFLPILQGILLITLGIFILNQNRFPTKLKNKKIISIIIRYLVLLILVASLTIIYRILTPLTIYPIAYFFKLFYSVSILQNLIIINSKTFIQIIPPCVAGSAYLLLLILNLITPMKQKQRIHSILFSISLLFIINLSRIIVLSFFVIQDSQLFDFAHKLFWYLLSTIFVVGIWLLTLKIFKIKNIPAYTDMKYLIGNIRK